ncbi:LexA family transcriptional regulator [Rhodanobacter sp. Root480]|jgi:repressor LexA|uniref:transcriptional repressor LexA n=1 Tax=Rhodanobacter sp. Root480 TaxID=1736542 RepID=UPI0006FE3093|nr:transcriptional repressor LexA [Rhodanobacter sp. Root480]KQX99380.1 LexA family transcriptional regulator [Rhodanobacter sp. Root480]
MTLQLTARQSNILDFIRDRLDHTGQAPTLEEIGQAMGLANVSAVLKHVRSLEAKGRLQIEPNRSRGIRLVTSADPLDADTMELPLVGRIAAGEPLFSDARVERTLRVSSWLFRLKPDYLVRVVGDSMRDEGILDQDIVGVHATPVARHGQVVAARVGGDRFTIKRLYWQGDVIRLLPNSPGYQPIDPDPTEDFAIEGLFAGLLRGS